MFVISLAPKPCFLLRLQQASHCTFMPLLVSLRKSNTVFNLTVGGYSTYVCLYHVS